MSTLVSITVVVDDGAGNRTFQVDTTKDCVLVWGDAGWDVLADYYEKAKHNPAKAKEVRDRKCPKAKPKQGETSAVPATGDPVIALKDEFCEPTQWP
ncbi:MAG TPA: hypothetical protein VFV26_07655 [Geothrix sp.]|nr:hypothetical protein [Geothrix sp.]